MYIQRVCKATRGARTHGKNPRALSPRTRSARARARPTTCVRAGGEPRAPLGAADPESNEVSAMNREETTRRDAADLGRLALWVSREARQRNNRRIRAGRSRGSHFGAPRARSRFVCCKHNGDVGHRRWHRGCDRTTHWLIQA